MNYLESAAHQFGYKELWLETRRINARAVRFYEKNGYQPVMNYGPYVGREEAVCMAKILSASP